MFWYLINLKYKSIGNISKFIIKNFKNNKKIKILILNEKLIKKNYNYKKNYYYKHSKYIGNYKKIYLKNCEEKEIIKNSIIKMIKNKNLKKIIKKNIKFLNKNNLIKNLKNKILHF